MENLIVDVTGDEYVGVNYVSSILLYLSENFL